MITPAHGYYLRCRSECVSSFLKASKTDPLGKIPADIWFHRGKVQDKKSFASSNYVLSPSIAMRSTYTLIFYFDINKYTVIFYFSVALMALPSDEIDKFLIELFVVGVPRFDLLPTF